MSFLSFFTLFLWLVFIGYWIAAIYRISHKSLLNEVQGLISLVGTAFIVYIPIPVWFLSRHVIPHGLYLEVAGAILCLAGILFASWGRKTLGKSWSAAVAVQEKHELITTGPYAIVRHPMYSGLLLALLGTSITIGTLWGFLVTFILTLGIIGKIQSEERLLNQFKYQAYRSRVKALLPYIW